MKQNKILAPTKLIVFLFLNFVSLYAYPSQGECERLKKIEKRQFEQQDVARRKGKKRQALLSRQELGCLEDKEIALEREFSQDFRPKFSR